MSLPACCFSMFLHLLTSTTCITLLTSWVLHPLLIGSSSSSSSAWRSYGCFLPDASVHRSLPPFQLLKPPPGFEISLRRRRLSSCRAEVMWKVSMTTHAEIGFIETRWCLFRRVASLSIGSGKRNVFIKFPHLREPTHSGGNLSNAPTNLFCQPNSSTAI